MGETTSDYQEGTKVNVVPNSNCTLYAKWKENVTDVALTAALNVAAEGANIYVFAGTYSDALAIDVDNVTIYGPNYNIQGTDSRNPETIISNNINVAADNFSINGIKLTGKQINITSNISNLSIKCIISTSQGTFFKYSNGTGSGRQGVIGTEDSNIDKLEVSNCKLTNTGAAGRNIFVFYGVVSNAIIFENDFNNGSSNAGSSELLRAEKVSGVFNFSNNHCVYSTGNQILQIGSVSNKCTKIDIIENTFVFSFFLKKILKISTKTLTVLIYCSILLADK